MAKFARRYVYPPVPLDYFGMHTLAPYPYSDWPTGYTVGALGKGTVEGWFYSNPSLGVYDWSGGGSGHADEWDAVATTNSVGKFYLVGGPPAWAGTPGTGALNNGTDLPTYLEAFLARFYGPGKPTTIIEPASEPSGLWPAANLANFCNVLVPAVREFAPGCLITTPNFYGGIQPYFQDYLNAGGTTDFDIVSIHTYPGITARNWPEDLDRNAFTPNLATSPVLSGSITKRWDPTIAAWGLKRKPVWNTESSWGQEGAGAVITDQDQQAAFVSRYLLLHWSNRYARHYWYAHDNTQLWGRLEARKGEIAYGETQDWMLGAKLESRIMPGGLDRNLPGSVYEGYWTRTDPAGYEAYCAWDFGTNFASPGGGYNGSYSYTVPAGMNFYRDLDGVSTATSPGASVTIGSKPLWFESHDTT